MTTSTGSAFTCLDCDITVTQSRRFHNRTVHQQSVQVTGPGNQVRWLYRMDDKTFHCGTCSYTSKNPDKLRDHYTTCVFINGWSYYLVWL